MMKNFEQLFEGWMAGTLSKEEVNVFLDRLEQTSAYPNLIDAALDNSEHKGLGNVELMEKLYSRILVSKDTVQAPVRKLFPAAVKWAAAILVFIGAATAWWMIRGHEDTAVPVVTVNGADQLLPGGDRAILLLSNGEKLILDSVANGQLAKQEGALIYKSEEGQLDYKQQASTGGVSEKIAYNTLFTPKGGQYKLTLPDGTKVWLNAGSSIRYPTVFDHTERKVDITGEVYFEVAKVLSEKGNRKKPFKVVVNDLSANRDMEIEVLGTHFNVNAYANEPAIRTTLFEGSVRLKKDKDKYLLQPGQQAQFNTNGENKIMSEINAEEVLAWKNGLFVFDHTDLQTVMRQLERWYDVQVEYRGAVPDMKFGGEIPRNARLQEVLNTLQKSKLRFITEGRKIIVIP
ncbi:FecR family protein [Pseudobacter ginsenosidimutans]|uniref:FecR family protein n=1 Tax=Pseudobacter ginsenosidimutans TaxID=661488 RepID=A0A4Q7N2S3_9BACT|nr:FecR family protein [Pseudobacter ginsenosidimutans]QEC42925.1 DUF4974 domain-containing protein [Pseudobacter ginsenosidimutans]RZS74278.1 FecR family protein [Pseudobacter ginsenosidimutans]